MYAECKRCELGAAVSQQLECMSDMQCEALLCSFTSHFLPGTTASCFQPYVTAEHRDLEGQAAHQGS